jgi:gliding motility-associated-like protein
MDNTMQQESANKIRPHFSLTFRKKMSASRRILFFLFLAACVSSLHAQSWIWGKDGHGDSFNSGQEGVSICTDTNANVFICGTYFGAYLAFNTDTFFTNNGDQVVVAKYDANGNYLWARSSSGAGAHGWASGVATDDSGNVYMTGKFSGSLNFGSYSLVAAGTGSIFLVKYNANGNLQWAESPGNNGGSLANSIWVDPDGTTFLTGSFTSPAITFGPVTLTTPGFYLAKFDRNGNALNAVAAAGGQGFSVCRDPAGNILATGAFAGSGMVFGSTTLVNSAPPYADVFIAKFDAALNFQWAQSAGGYSDDYGFCITSDFSGNIFIAGYFRSTFANFGSYVVTNAGGDDGFFAKYNPSGSLAWVITPGFSQNDYDFGLTTDALGNIYVSGGLYSSSFIYSPLIFGQDTLRVPNGSSDPLFIVKYDPQGNPRCASFLPTGGDDLNSIAVNKYGDVFVGGDIVQPITIGSDALTVTGAENIFVSRFRCACDLNAAVTGITSICAGDTALLSVTGGIDYTWSTGSFNDSVLVFPASSATYSVVASYGTCADTVLIPLTVNQPPGVSVVSQTLVACAGDSTGIATINATTGTAPFTYDWQPYGGNGAAATALTPGNYVVSVTDANGCTTQQQIFIDSFPLPQVVAQYDTTILQGGAALLFSSGGVDAQWMPADGLNCDTCFNPVASPVKSTTYCVVVTDSNGCRASACVRVDVLDCPVFIPNAFSPNHDGQNDFLCVRSNCIDHAHFSVYDRWGEKVFETDDVTECWDGTYRGRDMESAVFYYVLDATLFSGKKIMLSGNVSLVK